MENTDLEARRQRCRTSMKLKFQKERKKSLEQKQYRRMTEKCLKLTKHREPQVQEALRILGRLNFKKQRKINFTPRNITIKSLKSTQLKQPGKPEGYMIRTVNLLLKRTEKPKRDKSPGALKGRERDPELYTQ